MKMVFRSLAVVLGLTTLAPSVPAFASGDNGGSVGAGGVVRGDISRQTGETDRISIDLTAGVPLRLALSSTFAPSVVLNDPGGAEIPLPPPNAGGGLHVDVPVATPGTYALAVSSADGSQGLYTLRAQPVWERRLHITGTGPVVLDVPMPARRRLAGRIGPGVRILGLQDPGGAPLLRGAIEPGARTTRLPATRTGAAGVYRLALEPIDDGVPWTADLTRLGPLATRGSLRLANGLDPVSFAADGVGRIFSTHCAGCHGWALSYAGVRGSADRAYGKLSSGAMPPGGGVTPLEIELVRLWIKTGERP